MTMNSEVGHVIVTVMLLGMMSSALAIGYSDMFAFGEVNGDAILEAGDDISSREQPLTTPITFYSKQYSSYYVNNNGLVSFDTDISVYQPNMKLPFGYDVLAVFFSDVDTTYAGTVYHRETTDTSQLQKAQELVRTHFEYYPSFAPTAVVVVTWDNVGYYSANDTFLNTFQVAVASDGQNSFVAFLYPDSGINWITSMGKHTSVPDLPAQAGIATDQESDTYLLPKSGTDDVYDLSVETNVGESGLWMYQLGQVSKIGRPLGDVDMEVIEFNPLGRPCDLGQRECHVSAQCVDYDEGFCCECLPHTFGNGKSCVPQGDQLRLHGRINGILNGEFIDDLDFMSDILTSDARTYTAIRGIPSNLGTPFLTLNSLGGVMAWLFANVTNPQSRNGFMLTGGRLNRTSVVTFDSGENATIRQIFHGSNDLQYLKLETVITGSTPALPAGARVSQEPYYEEYRRMAPGVVVARSQRSFTVDGEKRDYTWDETIVFEECLYDPSVNALATDRLHVKRSYLVYNEKDEYVQYIFQSEVGVSSDLDPCVNNPCGPNSICQVIADNVQCTCVAGYRFSSSSDRTCEDVNECDGPSPVCDPNAQCYNVPGSFQCQCYPGYRGDGYRCERTVQRCGDDICHEHARCVYNSDLQRPMCECNAGFQGDGLTCSMESFTCNEVDICHQDAECKYDGDSDSYYCECGDGYSGDGITCMRLGQCTSNDDCDGNAQCIIGSDLVSRCTCNHGYSGNGLFCSPITVPHGCEHCDVNAACQLGDENYECVCLQGFIGNGSVCEASDCRSIDRCSSYADCVYDPFMESHRCLCRNGYTGDGYTCTPEDCLYDNFCHADAVCVQDPAGSDKGVCQCRPGFQGDGMSCSVVSCNQVNNCDPNAQCVYDPTARSYRCQCNRGYDGDGQTCQVRGNNCVIDPRLCDVNARCMESGDAYLCVCNAGYEGDGRRCMPMNQENYLLMSRGYTIQKVPFAGGKDVAADLIIYDTDQLIIALDVNCKDRTFYWTDVSQGKIHQANVNGSGVTTIVSDLLSPEGVAVDWVSGNLYWTDSGSDVITVSRLDGSYAKRIVQGDMENPRALVLNPYRGMMYWTDWNRAGPRIEKAQMDGQERQTLVDRDLGLPNGLAINYYTQEICWGDAGVQKIECIRTDGEGRMVVTADAPYPFAMTSLDNEIFWSDWSLKGVARVNKGLGGVRDTVDLPVGGNGKVYGIAVVRTQCPRLNNACIRENGGCPFLCLPTPNGGRSCVCPDDADGTECNEIRA